MADPKKGTKGTEVIIGSAVKELKKVIDSIPAAVETVKQLAEEAEHQQGIIAQREDQIKALNVEFSETKRQKEVELEVSLQQNEKDIVDKILSKQNLVTIDKDEHIKLTTQMANIKAEAVADANRTTAIAIQTMERNHANEKALAIANFEKEQAQTVAKLSTMESQVTFLTAQANMWKESLEAERAAGVERAKAASIGTLSIGNTAKN